MKLQARGYPMQCSAQILNETDWIIDSTSDYARADKNLWLLELSLGDVDQDFALQQLETDGSWGVCYDEWFKSWILHDQRAEPLLGGEYPAEVRIPRRSSSKSPSRNC